eukprot:6189925-Pleurochrysis_carterae.AAC.1
MFSYFLRPRVAQVTFTRNFSTGYERVKDTELVSHAREMTRDYSKTLKSLGLRDYQERTCTPCLRAAALSARPCALHYLRNFHAQLRPPNVSFAKLHA